MWSNVEADAKVSRRGLGMTHLPGMGERVPSSNQNVWMAQANIAPGFGYRHALKEIDEGLSSQDVEALKFLCQDLIPTKKQEGIQRGLDLMNELESQRRIQEGEISFLAELILRIGRNDLLKKLGHNASSVREELQKFGSHLSPYRVLLQEICDDLISSEVDTMQFLARAYVPRKKAEDIKDAYSLFQVLEQTEVMSQQNIGILFELTQAVERRDLVEKLNRFLDIQRGRPATTSPLEPHGSPGIPPSVPQTSQPVPTAHPQERPPLYLMQEELLHANRRSVTGGGFLDPPPCYTPWPTAPQGQGTSETGARPVQIGDPVQRTQPPPYRVNRNSGILGPNDALGGGTVAMEMGNRVVQMVVDSRVIEDELPSYQLNARPRGICLIINNRHFYKVEGDKTSKRMPIRDGTEIDCGNLEYIFHKLNFHVVIKEDLTEEEMQQEMLGVARADHTHYDCFVCCLLSHGTFGNLYGVNGRLIPIRDLLACYKSNMCPSLNGKPKMFFVQACQGKEKQQGYTSQEEDEQIAPEEDAPEDVPPDTIPNEGDFLLGYATLPGFVSYRSRTHGSWYITKLVEMLDTYSDRYDLLSILVKVNEEVSRATALIDDKLYKQSPAPLVTLRKKVHFR